MDAVRISNTKVTINKGEQSIWNAATLLNSEESASNAEQIISGSLLNRGRHNRASQSKCCQIISEKNKCIVCNVPRIYIGNLFSLEQREVQKRESNDLKF